MNFVRGEQSTNTLVAEDTMAVVMAPGFALSLHALLGQAIENYKATFGELRGGR